MSARLPVISLFLGNNHRLHTDPLLIIFYTQSHIVSLVIIWWCWIHNLHVDCFVYLQSSLCCMWQQPGRKTQHHTITRNKYINIYIQGDRHFLEQTLAWRWDRWNKHFLLNIGLVENVWLKSYKDLKFEIYWRQIERLNRNKWTTFRATYVNT